MSNINLCIAQKITGVLSILAGMLILLLHLNPYIGAVSISTGTVSLLLAGDN